MGNLPAEVNSFVGRRREISEIKTTLSSARLVTLTGIGGVGKTRLALRVATQLRRRLPHGAWLVQLGTLKRHDLLAETVASTFGLVQASAAASASLIDELLGAAPGLRVLTTSRHALRIPAEHVVRVQPLPVPRSEGVVQRRSAAMQLFSERASAAEPGFQVTQDNWLVVADICRELDGIPLGIELATAWLRALSPEEILQRLDDRFRLLTHGSRVAPARYRTLRAMLDWSYDLCSDEEKSLWARLSVFADGFDLHAAEQVCGGVDLSHGVAALVDKSVLQRRGDDSSRYSMLETIRQYGQLKLGASGERPRLRMRHRDHFLALAQRCAAEWFGPDQSVWCARLRAGHANLRFALDYCATVRGEARTGLRMAAALWFYWSSCGAQPAEQRFWLDEFLALDTGPSRQRAEALQAASAVAAMRGDVPACHEHAVESLAVAAEVGAESLEANAIRVLGLATLMEGDHSRAADLLGEALRRFDGLGVVDTFATITRFELAAAHLFLGDPDRAARLCRETVRLCEARGERWVLSYVLNTLVLISFGRADLRAATRYARQCLEIKQSFRDVIGIRIIIELSAWIAGAENQAERAAELLGAGEMIRRTFGLAEHISGGYVAPHENCVANASRALGDPAFHEAFSRGDERTLDEAVSLALEGPESPTSRRRTAGTGGLTHREVQVAQLIALGLSNQEIAKRLVISRRTAEGHVGRIMGKLAFTSRSQIATWAVERRSSLDS